MKKIVFVSVWMFLFNCIQSFAYKVYPPNNLTTVAYRVPLAGNAFVNNYQSKTNAIISKNGLVNWMNAQEVVSVYVKIPLKGKINLAIEAQQDNAAASIIQVSMGEKSYKVNVMGDEMHTINVGVFEIEKPGYVQIQLKGLSKKGKTFADIENLILYGEAIDKNIIYSNQSDYYYWARRGPSCHLNYQIPATKEEKVMYYYSELEVPKGEDVEGSYFMANGFGEGYFGMQVNSASERRILFSVWSPFQTDDPKSIPDNQKILMLKRGVGVYTGEFGSEGSGGQSYLKLNWKANQTYKFLLKAQPDGQSNTIYTAWFFDTDHNKWLLIASFKRPKTNTYLTRFHSFIENFNPNQGAHHRKAKYKNQWIGLENGEWRKIKSATFSVDNTYRAKQRLDASGGANTEGFYLENGGFFDTDVEPGTVFEVNNSNSEPDLDLNQLP